MRFAKMGVLAAAVLSLCGVVSQTRADSIDPTPIIVGGSASGAGAYFETESAGVFHYSVTFQLSANQFLSAGTAAPTLTSNSHAPNSGLADFFLLNDFQGVAISSPVFTAAIGTWTLFDSSSNSFGFYNSGSTITSGSTPLTLGTVTFTSTTDLSLLPIQSNLNVPIQGGVGAGQIGGFADYNDGTPNGIRLAAAPLPAAAWMGSSLLLGAALVANRRKLRLA